MALGLLYPVRCRPRRCARGWVIYRRYTEKVGFPAFFFQLMQVAVSTSLRLFAFAVTFHSIFHRFLSQMYFTPYHTLLFYQGWERERPWMQVGVSPNHNADDHPPLQNCASAQHQTQISPVGCQMFTSTSKFSNHVIDQIPAALTIVLKRRSEQINNWFVREVKKVITSFQIML